MESRRVALITGSSRDIGRATVLKLAGEGVNVVVHSVQSKDLGEAVAEQARGLGVDAVYCQAHIRDLQQVREMFGRAQESVGHIINVLVNNAGWTSPSAFEENTPDYWDRIVRTKFYGFITPSSRPARP